MASIGAAYSAKVVGAFIGPAHSSLIPTVLWGGWLDATYTLIAMTGLPVSHDSFGEVTNGMANIEAIDAGVAGVGWTPYYFALFDAASAGNVVCAAAVTPWTPATDALLVANVGDLVFTLPGPFVP